MQKIFGNSLDLQHIMRSSKSGKLLVGVYSCTLLDGSISLNMQYIIFSVTNILVQALLSGCSAGGLATFLHCDDFKSLLPENASVKCLSDAGFFLNL